VLRGQVCACVITTPSHNNASGQCRDSAELRAELRVELRAELRAELCAELCVELYAELQG